MVAMVGRDQELASVLRCLIRPEVALTLVSGEAGIGKSRLVAEAVAATPERLTLAGACLPMRRVLPLLPFVDALDMSDPAGRRALTRAVGSLPGSLRPHLAGVMPRTLPEEIQPPAEVGRDLLFLATEALLSRVAEERPVTLVVEDVHWADPDTVDLLTYLAGARHSTAISLLVTCRTDETQMTEPVAAWLDAQRRSSLVHELVLRPLDPQGVRCLVAGLPHPDSAKLDDLSARIFARGEGNPFFTEQLVASAAAGEEVPARLTKLLSARVRAVSPTAQDAVTALAVLARPVPLTALQLVTQQTDDACLAAVRELESASLIVRDARGVRPRHALLTETLVSEVPGLSAAYHQRVAAALESLNDPSTTPEIADHLHQAGDEPAELRMAQLAGQRAWDLGAYADAARWYQRVTELHTRHRDEPLFLPEPEIVRRTLRALDLSGARRQATALAENAAQYFAKWPNTLERLRLLTYRAHLVSIEEPDRGLSMLQDLLSQYEAMPPHSDHADTLYFVASQHLVRGDSRTGLALADQARAIAHATGNASREASALARMSGCLRQLGDRAAADRFAAEATRVAERCPDVTALLAALINESDNRLKYAEYSAAAAAAGRGIDLADQKGLRRSFAQQLLVGNAAEAYLALGRTVEVGRLVDALTDTPIRTDDEFLSVPRAHADLRRGDPTGALKRLRGSGGNPAFNAEAARIHAESLAYVLLWNRRPTEALDVVENSLPAAAVGDWSQAIGLMVTLGAQAGADLAASGRSTTDANVRLDELREAIALDPFAERDTLPRASADGRQWRAERTRAVGKSDPDAWTEAALAWESLSMPHDAGYCWWRAAEALLGAGAGKGKVRTALQAAHGLSAGHIPLRDEIAKTAVIARMPIVHELNLDGQAATKKGLTAQEVKVLRLLAGGLTNAEIGTALFISPKTASVHVSNLIRKLDVTNRTEAATWATRNGLTGDP